MMELMAPSRSASKAEKKSKSRITSKPVVDNEIANIKNHKKSGKRQYVVDNAKAETTNQMEEPAKVQTTRELKSRNTIRSRSVSIGVL